MPKIETAEDAIKYLELAVKVEGWQNPEQSASWQIMQVIKKQQDVIAQAKIRARLVAELIEKIGHPDWVDNNPEFKRDRDIVLEWAVVLSSHEESELRTLAEKLAKSWLADDSNTPLPVVYELKRGKGERV